MTVFVLVLLISNLSKKDNAQLEEKFYPSRSISSKEITKGDTSKNQVIFTFDGGSEDISAKQVLKILQKHKVKGTFFLNGKFIEKFPETTRGIFMNGNEIFNHTYDHKSLIKLTDEEIKEEFSKTERILKETLVGFDIYPSSYFRAPYGERDSRVITTAYANGYQSVFWTVDAKDWRESEGVTANDVKNIILSKLAPGNIYLMHLGDTITGSVLDDVFTEIESRGYKIVSLTEGI